MRLAAVLLSLLLASCTSSTERELERISALTDPGTLSLQQGFNSYVRRAFLDGGTEVGIIQLADGSSARYWFRSHHLTGDDGGTLFRLSDGSRLYMSGYFCCEVQLPEPQLASLTDLRAFVRERAGLSP